MHHIASMRDESEYELNPQATSDGEFDLDGRFVALVGQLGGHNRRDATRLLRQRGATTVDISDERVDLIVIGADELPVDNNDHLNEHVLGRAAEGQIEIIGETQLWQRLGLLEPESLSRRLYTPAMLAELLGVSVKMVRRWYRHGLIVPAREVNRLPYFDFQEISVARQLARLVDAGISQAAIREKLDRLASFLPDVQRPLAQLSVLIEGREILLRQGAGLIEPSGQRRIDFESLEVEESETAPISFSFDSYQESAEESLQSLEDYVDLAGSFEDTDRPQLAIKVYRSAILAFGVNAEICFRMGELFSLMDEPLAARERYFMAIELAPEYIEARANLGCVLMELGQWDLAIAAFQGALEYHPDYPDVHFHLARIYDDLDQAEEANHYWQRFLELAPESPWADEAQMRLAEELAGS